MKYEMDNQRKDVNILATIMKELTERVENGTFVIREWPNFFLV